MSCIRSLLTHLATTGIVLSATSTTSGASPNIVFILADDLGWSDLGCYGNTFVETPALDHLAREGMRFTQAYAAAPVCTPARAGLLTGKHPARLHVTGQPGYRADPRNRKLWHPPFRTDLDHGTPTIASTLATAGYVSSSMGKYGLDEPATRDGFGSVVTGPDDYLLAEAVAFLRARASDNRLFLLYFNPHRVHVPLQPDADLKGKYAAKPRTSDAVFNPEYAAEVESLDRDISILLTEIESLGLRDNTIVVFTSDNGGFLGPDGTSIASNAPLREGKASLYEGGIRVPLIVRWPGSIRDDSLCDTPVHGIDWAPTLAEMVGVAQPSDAGFDGKSIVSLLRGEPMPARNLFWHFPHYRRSMAGISASPSSAVRDGEWKLIHFYEDDHVELYNLREDPGEQRDLSSQLPRRAGAMLRDLDAWRAEVHAQKPVPVPSPWTAVVHGEAGSGLRCQCGASHRARGHPITESAVR